MRNFAHFILVMSYFANAGCTDTKKNVSNDNCTVIITTGRKSNTVRGGDLPQKDAAISNGTAVVTETAVAETIKTTTRPPLFQGLRLPCSCLAGQCGCCTGMILERFRQKACVNFTYEPDDFALTTKMTINGRIVYKRTVSGKNPPPICVPVPRFRFITLCVEFSNIYLANRNIHMCIDAEASWEDFTLIEWSFDCLRLGANGVAVIGEEEGGGVPPTVIDEEEQTDEDYDDSARNEPQPANLRNEVPVHAKSLSNGTILFSLNEDFKTKSKNIKKLCR